MHMCMRMYIHRWSYVYAYDPLVDHFGSTHWVVISRKKKTHIFSQHWWYSATTKGYLEAIFHSLPKGDPNDSPREIFLSRARLSKVRTYASQKHHWNQQDCAHHHTTRPCQAANSALRVCTAWRGGTWGCSCQLQRPFFAHTQALSVGLIDCWISKLWGKTSMTPLQMIF